MYRQNTLITRRIRNAIAAFHTDVDFNGIVVFAYLDLLPFVTGHISRGANILRAFTETDLGDEVVDAGCMIPIISIDDDGYANPATLCVPGTLIQSVPHVQIASRNNGIRSFASRQ